LEINQFTYGADCIIIAFEWFLVFAIGKLLGEHKLDGFDDLLGMRELNCSASIFSETKDAILA
jgi:hypothetical protein